MTKPKTQKPCTNTACEIILHGEQRLTRELREACESYYRNAVEDGKKLGAVQKELADERVKSAIFAWCLIGLAVLFCVSMLMMGGGK